MTGPQAKCNTGGSAIGCASCILSANADDCCDCLSQAATTAGATLPTNFKCPLPGSCSRCGNVITTCENDCVTSFDVAKCAKCLNDNNGFGCCRCLKDLGVSSIDCAAVNAAANQVKAAVNQAKGAVKKTKGVGSKLAGAFNKVKNALP